MHAQYNNAFFPVIISTRSRGAPVGTSVFIGVGRGILLGGTVYLLRVF